jgi:hypothetical protein
MQAFPDTDMSLWLAEKPSVFSSEVFRMADTTSVPVRDGRIIARVKRGYDPENLKRWLRDLQTDTGIPLDFDKCSHAGNAHVYYVTQDAAAIDLLKRRMEEMRDFLTGSFVFI